MSTDTSQEGAQTFWRLLPLAFLCGAVVVMPHLIGIFEAGRLYTPFAVEGAHIITFDETVAYASPVRTAMEGALLSNAPQGPDRVNPDLQSPQALGRAIPTLLLAGISWCIGLANTFIVSDFIFPVLVFLVIVLLSRALSISFPAAVLASVVVILGDFLVDLPIDLLHDPGWALRHWVLSLDSPRPVEYSRTWVPQLTYPLLLLAVLSVWCVTQKDDWHWPLLAGFAMATNCYTYAYSWPVVFVGAGVFAILTAFQDLRAAARIAFAMLVGVLLSAPILWGLLHAEVGPDLIRYGHGQTGLAISAQKHRLLLTGLLLLLCPWGRLEGSLMRAFLVAPWICVAISMVTGVRLQEFHWIVRSWLPWTLITAVAVLDWRIPRDSRGKAAAFWFLTCILFLHGGHRQYQSALAALPQRKAPLDRIEPMEWIDENLSAQSVVVSMDWDALGIIPVRSAAGIYIPFGPLTPMKTQELLARFAHACAANGISRAKTHRLLGSGSGDVPSTAQSQLPHYWVLHMSRNDRSLTDRDRRTIDEAWTAAHRSIHQNGRLPYRADLLWVRTDNLPIPIGERWPVVYQNNTVTLLGSPHRLMNNYKANVVSQSSD